MCVKIVIEGHRTSFFVITLRPSLKRGGRMHSRMREGFKNYNISEIEALRSSGIYVSARKARVSDVLGVRGIVGIW